MKLQSNPIVNFIFNHREEVILYSPNFEYYIHKSTNFIHALIITLILQFIFLQGKAYYYLDYLVTHFSVLNNLNFN